MELSVPTIPDRYSIVPTRTASENGKPFAAFGSEIFHVGFCLGIHFKPPMTTGCSSLAFLRALRRFKAVTRRYCYFTVSIAEAGSPFLSAAVYVRKTFT